MVESPTRFLLWFCVELWVPWQSGPTRHHKIKIPIITVQEEFVEPSWQKHKTDVQMSLLLPDCWTRQG